ncbi:MAG TPA: ABC transporter permease [Pyrinomonadaceae bacterium]
METLLQDVRYGLRTLLKRPGFTVVAVMTLALGIGANAAIFSVVNGVLLRPLPYRDAERIMTVWQRNAQTGAEREPVSPPNFLDFRERNQSFEQLAALRPYGLDYTGAGEPETFQTWRVTEGFFEAAGAVALHGRTFLPEEYRDGVDQVVVIGHGLWQRRFGGDPGVVGQQLVLDGKPRTVVGVMPPEFHYLDKREMIAPYHIDAHELQRRAATYLNVVGRLKPGVTLEQARSDMSNVAARLAEEYPQANGGMGAAVAPLAEQMLGRVRPALWVLFGAVGFVLLIACANVANLMIARSASREREFAIRAALGAGRGRLMRQLLTESLVLAGLACAGGLLLASWGIDAIIALSPAELPRIDQVRLDGRVLLFALGVSAATALFFGLLPALRSSQPDLQESLKEASRSATAGAARHRLRGFLVVTEFALALVLLVGAGLLVRSFMRLLEVDPGFSAERALTLQVHVYDQYPKPEQQAVFFEQALERLRALPGVEAAGAASAPPFIGEGAIEIDSPIQIEGQPAPPAGQEPTAFHTIVTADYFGALGVPLRGGRIFNQFDRADGAPVVIVNETLARRYWPGESAVGKKLIVLRLSKPVAREVVGVVGDVRHTGLDSEPRPELFLHSLQNPFGSMTFVVRTTPEPSTLLQAVKGEVWAVNKNLPFYSTATMESLVAETLKERRFSLLLLGAFASLALVLAGVGIYGLISYSTAQRTHEIGVRVALGARGRDIMRMVVGEGLLLSGAGVALGLLGALVLTRFLGGLLYGVAPTDPLTFAGIALLLVCVALAACYLPARRAARVDPMVALRYE